MANTEVGIPEAEWQNTLNSFRTFYADSEASQELYSMALIAHHDNTIRFTNSTTSVMKSLLLARQLPADRTYLVQPAIGTQGIIAWEREGVLGPYPSYFHSMGGLYPYEMSTQASQEMLAIAERLGFVYDDLYYKASVADPDLIAVFAKSDVRYDVDHSLDTGSYRHTYGEEGLAGRNAKVQVRISSGVVRSLGSLTCIERNGSQIAWEVSFDSTRVIAQANQLPHPIDAYPHQVGLANETHRRVASDAAIVSAALLNEGMHPRSRGKSGILRKYLRSFVELGSHDKSLAELVSILGNVAITEMSLRDSAVSPLSDQYQINGPLTDAEVFDWVNKLRQLYT